MGLKNKKQSVDLFKKNVLGKIKEIKNNTDFKLPLYQDENLIGHLNPVKKSELVIKLLKAWREKSQYAFPNVFKVTLEGTEKWLEELVMKREDRILFMIKNKEKSYIGHLGFSNFDYEDKSCEIDNVVRGRNETKGIMTSAHYGLTDWAFSNLDLRRLTLRVFSDNEKAVSLYSRCGFKKLRDIPLKKIIKDEENWAFEEIEKNDCAERYHSVMELNNPYKSLEEN